MAQTLFELSLALELVALTLGYFLVDLALRGDGLLRVLRALGLGTASRAPLAWALACLAAACLAAAPFVTWEAVPEAGALRLLGGSLAAILTWKAITKDVDIVSGERHTRARWLLLAAAVGAWFSPAALLLAAFLLTTPFALWEHHSTLPMRVLQALVAHLALSLAFAPTALFDSATVFLFFAVMMLVSHYFITALAKGLLGPRWYSWVVDNRLHHMAASAYSWGWARFMPWSRWRRVIGAVARVEKPMQLAAFSVELCAPLALLHPWVAIGFCLAWAAFHAGVFSLSGLLFWDWILTDLALAGVIAMLPTSVTAQAFGPVQALVALAFMAVFPLRHKLWKPMPLGWFDTPFTQRIHWRVRGQSGQWYGLYNDFMCPHERLYGKVHGCFYAPTAVLTYHLGEVWKPELRDAIRAAGPDPERLDEVRRRFGIQPINQAMQAHHEAYLRCFFHALARGVDKSVLPRWLRWLKAPGDQIFYWGELPAYRGQEPATEVQLHYREEYFDGEQLCRIRDERVAALQLSQADVPEPVVELTPKQMDDYLLGLAKGRLIDLPGFRADYLHGDDGKTRSDGAPRTA